MTDPLTRARELFFQGIEHFEGNRLENAAAAFEVALSLTPGRPSILANLGITYFRLNRFAEAIPLLRQADATEPGKFDVLSYLGMALVVCGDWPAAADTLRRALAIDPQHAHLWLDCARSHQRCSNVGAALEAFDRAIAVEPASPAAWSEKGNLLREINQFDAAARCFEKAIELGADPELHRFYLAAVKQQGITSAPRHYVESLFDDYAADFEDHLVGQLKYQGYEILVRPLLSEDRRWKRVLDLGCGTGLCGKLLQAWAERIDGVDLSRAMLDRARQSGHYHELIYADVGEYMIDTDQRADLIVAADVFGYIADLQPVLTAARRVLEPGGCFAFTVEKACGTQDIELRPSLRHAHAEDYIRRLATACGFRLRTLDTAPLRDDQRDPVVALYVYLE